jgi:hypothetical protein
LGVQAAALAAPFPPPKMQFFSIYFEDEEKNITLLKRVIFPFMLLGRRYYSWSPTM